MDRYSKLVEVTNTLRNLGFETVANDLQSHVREAGVLDWLQKAKKLPGEIKEYFKKKPEEENKWKLLHIIFPEVKKPVPYSQIMASMIQNQSERLVQRVQKFRQGMRPERIASNWHSFYTAALARTDEVLNFIYNKGLVFAFEAKTSGYILGKQGPGGFAPIGSIIPINDFERMFPALIKAEYGKAAAAFSKFFLSTAKEFIEDQEDKATSPGKKPYQEPNATKKPSPAPLKKREPGVDPAAARGLAK